MKLIELAGCSGVGKSTLHEALRTKDFMKENFIFTDEQARQILARQILRSNRSLLQILLYPGIKIPLLNSFLCQKVLDGKYKKQLLRQHKAWEACLHSLFMRHSNSIKTLRSLYRYSALLTRMESQSFYRSFPCDNLMVMDSGLFYKVANILILLEEKQIDFATEEIYSSLPVIPDGIIHLVATPEIILDRIFSREKLKSSEVQEFKDIKKDKVYKRILLEEKVNHKGFEILKSRGVKILEVNASDDIGLQLESAIAFIEQMKNGITVIGTSKNEPDKNFNAHSQEILQTDSVKAKN